MMNSQLQTAEQSSPPVLMGFGSLASFEFLQRTASAFADSTMVPTAYQAVATKGYGDNQRTEPNPAAISNCMIALDMSQRMNANPLMIMQNLHIIEGRPSWSSQFIIAAINSSGRFSPLRFDVEWLDEMDATYSTFEWINRVKTEQKHNVRIKNARCVAWAIEKGTNTRLESAPVTMEMAVNEGWYSKNGSKWRSMPDLMLRYRSAAFFGRIYAPDLLMGLPTSEEMHDVFTQGEDGSVVHSGAQSVPASSGSVDPATGEVTPGLPAYTDERFAELLPKWRGLIASGKKTAAQVIATASSKGVLSDDQKAQINAPADATDPAVTDVKPKAESKKPAADVPVVTYAQVMDAMTAAKNEDALNEAATLINAVADSVHQEELSAEYERLLARLRN